MFFTVLFAFLRGVSAECSCSSGEVAAARTSFTPAVHNNGVTPTDIMNMQMMGCVTVSDFPNELEGKVELETMEGSSLSINLASNCSLDAYLVSVTYQDPELLVSVTTLGTSAGSKVGVTQLSVSLASFAFGLAAGCQRLYCNRQQLPAPITAAMLGLVQGAVADSEDCRYIVQVITPKPCFQKYSSVAGSACSLGAKLVDCPSTSLQTASVSRSASPSITASVSLSPVSASVSTSVSASISVSGSASTSASTTRSPSPRPNYFITTWNLTAGQTLNFPLVSTGSYNFQVDWGDGTSLSVCTTSSCSHVYANTSLYNVTIAGLLVGFSFASTFSTMASKLVDVVHWGHACLGDGGQQFRNIALSGWTASDAPCMSQVTNMQAMFYQAKNFNQDLSSWSTSKVTSMYGMFGEATSFNQDLSDWNTSLVTDFQNMFKGATNFNGDLSTWDTSRATHMTYMFHSAISFNRDISRWNTASVTVMNGMFYADYPNLNQVFNQDLSKWDVSKVADMAHMFNGANVFTQNLTTWNTASVTACYGFATTYTGLCVNLVPKLGFCNFCPAQAPTCRACP